MDIKSRHINVRLDDDIYDAIEARLEPGELVRDLANQLPRSALGLPLRPTEALPPPKDPEQSA